MRLPSGGLALLILCVVPLVTQVATAAELSDPTRPPEAQLGRASAEGGAAAGRLQSVLLSPGRNVAVINGETVKLGDPVGGARLVRITESAVVLRHPDREERLELIPGIEKTTQATRAAARAASARR